MIDLKLPAHLKINTLLHIPTFFLKRLNIYVFKNQNLQVRKTVLTKNVLYF